MASTARVAYSPGEFAELFGKSQTWGYRQIYAGKVNAITEHGRILIPAREVERILESAGIYNGKPTKSEKPKEEKLPPEKETIWRRFLKMRVEQPARKSPSSTSSVHTTRRPGAASGPGATSRRELLSNLKRSWSGKKREK